MTKKTCIKSEFSKGMMKALGTFFCTSCWVRRPVEERHRLGRMTLCSKCLERKRSYLKGEKRQ